MEKVIMDLMRPGVMASRRLRNTKCRTDSAIGQWLLLVWLVMPPLAFHKRFCSRRSREPPPGRRQRRRDAGAPMQWAFWIKIPFPLP
jgi:hypothetical protein